MPGMDTRGLIAVIIVVSFGVMINVIVVGSLITGRQMQAETINAVSSICGALIAVVSMYIGRTSKKD